MGVGIDRSICIYKRNSDLYAMGDSELIVKQMNREYTVNDPKLRILYTIATGLARRIEARSEDDCQVGFRLIPRDENVQADALPRDADGMFPRVPRAPKSAPYVSRRIGMAAAIGPRPPRIQVWRGDPADAVGGGRCNGYKHAVAPRSTAAIHLIVTTRPPMCPRTPPRSRS